MSCYSDIDGYKIKWSWQELENITAFFLSHKNNKAFYLKSTFLTTQGHSANKAKKKKNSASDDKNIG